MGQFIRAATIIAATAFAATPASALVNRAFASGTGTDSASCGTVAAPCKTLQFVHDKVVNPGGEIVLMGSGEYGPITITKALSIVNNGAGVASVTQATAAQNAIYVKAAATDVVLLRGLTLDGAWAASAGVYVQSGGTLQMMDCVVRRFKGLGVYAAPAAGGKIIMTNIVISDASSGGALIAPAGSFAGVVQGLKVTNVPNGFELSGRNAPTGSPIYMLVSDSFATGTSNGFLATSIDGKAIPSMALDGVYASGNGIGVVANRGNARLANSLVVGNGTGVSISSGSVRSNKTNSIQDNGANVLGGTISAISAD